MAKINKTKAVSEYAGLPTKEQILTAPQNIDTVPATIKGLDGVQEAPAALTEGEFVFSLPAIIALGDGDYDTGIGMLEQAHEELRLQGEAIMTEMNGEAA
jgi:hypothetical protein